MNQTKTWWLQSWEQLLTETYQNKNMMRTRYIDLGQSGELYRRKLNIEAKSQEEIGMETSFEADSPQGGTANRGPVPPGGEEPLDSVSNSFSSRDFSYLIKIIKVLREKFHANLF
jgi:hypothetical protein